jgi:hypothetical protein
MPVRSSTSSVLRWPDATTVRAAVRAWADEALAARPETEALALFGSYARGDWGVGSDLDLLAIVPSSELPFERRSLDWDLSGLPVPAELRIYTREEWERLRDRGARLVRTVEKEGIWLRGTPATGSSSPP